MEFIVDDVMKLTIVDKLLVSSIDAWLMSQNWYSTNHIERYEEIFDGATYYFKEKKQGDWLGNGKYQDSTIAYQLVKTTNDNQEEYLNLFVNLNVSRVGSYFTDYEYIYSSPELFVLDVIDVEEVRIPAHKEVIQRCI